MSEFAPKVGCPLCSIVSSPYDPSSRPPPSGGQAQEHPRIIWKDKNVTAYVERNNPVSSKGHVVIVLNLHVPSIYSLSSSDLPLLSHIERLAPKLLVSSSTYDELSRSATRPAGSNIHVGFITSPFFDPKIPVKDHLHVHVYDTSPDLAGWWRRVAYSGVAWYAIEDLIAEIREQTSNNRIRTHSKRTVSPPGSVGASNADRADGTGASSHRLGLVPAPSNRQSDEYSPLNSQPGDGPATGTDPNEEGFQIPQASPAPATKQRRMHTTPLAAPVARKPLETGPRNTIVRSPVAASPPSSPEHRPAN